MKKTPLITACLATAMLSLILKPDLLAADDSHSTISGGVRHHQEHSAFTELPFGNGDYSYGIAYEYHENAAYWQLALDAAFDLSGTNAVSTEFDYALTPQINLVFKDKLWRGGAGAAATYMMDKTTSDGDWTDIYWQFLLGLAIPLGKLEFEVLAVYPFEAWGDLGDFDAGDIDVVGWLKLSF